jgi:Ca2+-transporting ATPase
MNETDKPVQWHAIEPEAILEQLQAEEDGLDATRADQLRAEVGANSLEVEEGTQPWKLLLRQLNDPLVALLGIAALVSFLIGHRLDAVLILVVIVANTLLGYFQEWRAEGAIEALRKMSAHLARVRRDGQVRSIEADQVVPGDILILETGDRVAADARILACDDLKTDESALTGESMPVGKAPGVLDADAPMADQVNMVWMSTNVTGGRGRAVVVETGMRTAMGRIAGEVHATIRESTPLQRRMQKLSMVLGIGGVVLAGVVFVLGILRGYGWGEMLLYSVAVAVSAIPEGLPAVISVTLALGVRRMAQRNAIIRRMSAVETLGSTTVICTDKTGTITENQMTVRRLWVDDGEFEATGDGYRPEGTLLRPDGEQVEEMPEGLRQLLRIGALANNANLRQGESGWVVEGNPSEGALLAVAIKSGLEIEELRGTVKRHGEIAFSSDAKYMATLHDAPEGADSERVAYVKGSPERILSFSTHILRDGKPEKLTEELRKRIREAADGYAAKALRVLAGAYRLMPQEQEGMEPSDVETGLTLVGLWAMFDPPREESARAVRDAKEAGIHPVMITGDHATTALAIARQVGITEGDSALTGADIDAMEKPELAEAALAGGVFARVSPAHKLKLMEALKAHGQIVAMTGDGVNDAPALKGADIGIAMGRAGTEVAKEAADMVLTDDNFATIVHAVEEGRVIYSNLRRVVYFLLTTNLGEIVTLVAALVLGIPLPLTAVMILWINLVTDAACTVPLGVEPRHSDVLKHPPRDPKAFIIDKMVGLRMLLLMPLMAAGTIGMFWYAWRHGSLAHARTMAFTAMAAFQWFQAFNARSNFQSIFTIGLLSNRPLLWGIGAAIFLQLLAVHTPIGHTLLGTTHLSGWDWFWIVLVSSSIWVADELFKKLGVYGRD